MCVRLLLYETTAYCHFMMISQAEHHCVSNFDDMGLQRVSQNRHYCGESDGITWATVVCEYTLRPVDICTFYRTPSLCAALSVSPGQEHQDSCDRLLIDIRNKWLPGSVPHVFALEN